MTLIGKVLDWEVTTSNKGNPFDRNNKAVGVACKEGSSSSSFRTPEEFIQESKTTVSSDYLHIYFNAKFDMHWSRKCGVEYPDHIWCCQLAEFYLGGQRFPYPSLDNTAYKYGLGRKLDVVKTEYWDKGIDTDAIPWPVLSDYGNQDAELTYQVYLKQLALFQANPKLYALYKIACEDLKILAEMEWNGLKYDEELCNERALSTEKQLNEIDDKLKRIYPDLTLNFGSGDQLSAFLYGGSIFRESKEAVGVFKTGPRAGQIKYKLVVKEHQLPRLVEPLSRSELLKPGYFATDEGTLKKLKGKAAKRYVPLLLERARLEKLLGTYYRGLPKLAANMNWEKSYLHGQFNQVVAATGRLSSTKPNLQNFAGEIEDVITTRY